MRILVIEDSKRLADTIAEALHTQNYIVDTAYDGQTGYENALSGIYDMILLDLMLPKRNGYEILSELRKEGYDVPILILSARTELEDKIRGFMIGADDYVTKPFEIRELLMRIRAITRRRRTTEPSLMQLGNLQFDPRSCAVSNKDTGKSMQLSGKELQLLELFLHNPNRILEKEQIATKIWGFDSNTEYNNVEVYVSFLRRKFHHLQIKVTIRAVRGVGYIMEEAND